MSHFVTIEKTEEDMEDIITVVAARASQARDRSDKAIRTSNASFDFAEEAYREAHEATNLAVMSMAISIASALFTALMVRLGG